MIDKNVCEKQQINYKKTTPSIGQLHVHVSESRQRGKINTFINGLYRSARQRANSLLIDHIYAERIQLFNHSRYISNFGFEI